MLLTLLKAKLHHARVTHCELEYEGSCAIDQDLLDAVGIKQYEQIHMYNLRNGQRWITYAISAPAGSRMISVNGAAAHLALPKDRVIICSFAQMTEVEALVYQPQVLRLDALNNPAGSHKEQPCPV